MSGCSCPACPHASSAECWVSKCSCCGFAQHMGPSLAARGGGLPRTGPPLDQASRRAAIARQKKIQEAEYGWRTDDRESDDRDEAGQ